MAKFDQLKIAKSVKEELRLRPVRRQLLEKCGKDALLDPDRLKYPVIMPGKGCKPDCRLVHAAYVRAREWKQTDIAEKAKALMEKNDCWKKLGLNPSE